MYNYPSRKERRQEILFDLASRGQFETELILYPSEINNLKKAGFKITVVSETNHKRNLFKVIVSWSNPFGNSIPHLVYAYTNHIIETFPIEHAESFAKELYIIAKRKINK